MATDGFANRINGVEYAAVDERRMDASLLMPGASSAPFSARSGRRVNGSGLSVSVGGGPEAWTVTAGAGVIYDTSYASQGAWQFEIPAAISANLPARPGAGQSRIDLVVARIYDPGALGSGVAEVKVERIGGTAGATPTAPSLPALSVELARMTVPASGTISVTQSSRRTVAAGGVLPVSGDSDLVALASDGVAYPGLLAYNEQRSRFEGRFASTWAAIPSGDTGWMTLPLASGYVSQGTPFPAARVIGGVAYFRGAIARSSGSFTGPTSYAVVAAGGVPTGARPTTDGLYPAVGNATGTPVVRAQVNADGSISAIIGSDTQGYVSLAGISYPVS